MAMSIRMADLIGRNDNIHKYYARSKGRARGIRHICEYYHLTAIQAVLPGKNHDI